MFLLSLYFQDVLHYSSQHSGLAFLPLMASPLLANVISARAIPRYGPRAVATAGFLCAASGAFALTVSSTHTPYLLMGACLTLIGFGGGLAMPALGHIYLHDLPKAIVGGASGVFNAVGQTGILLGVAILGGLTSSGTVASLHIGALITGCVLATAAYLAWRFTRMTYQ